MTVAIPVFNAAGTIDKTLQGVRSQTYAIAEERVIFGDRVGTYRYLDMHQAIGAALKAFERELLPLAVPA